MLRSHRLSRRQSTPGKSATWPLCQNSPSAWFSDHVQSASGLASRTAVRSRARSFTTPLRPGSAGWIPPPRTSQERWGLTRDFGAPCGSRTRLFTLKSGSDANDFNVHFDFSRNVPMMEHQRHTAESTCTSPRQMRIRFWRGQLAAPEDEFRAASSLSPAASSLLRTQCDGAFRKPAGLHHHRSQ